MVSREAVLLISLATEEFVKRISEASHRLASRENRLTVQRKDIGECHRSFPCSPLRSYMRLQHLSVEGQKNSCSLKVRALYRNETLSVRNRLH